VDELLSTAEAARLAGVGTTSVKRWADEGVLECLKTAGGHRRFERAAVERFLREQGPAVAETSSARWATLLTRAGAYELRAALFGARADADAWYEVCDELGPAIAELGARWECGDVSVLEEHVASERLSRALAQISDALPVSERGPVCLLACAEGDDHTLGLSLAELCLREAGWATLWAGRRTPVADLVGVVERGEAGMVALSASTIAVDPDALSAQVKRLESSCAKHRVPLALGGGGPWPGALSHAVRFTSFRPFHAFATDALAKARRAPRRP